MIRIGRHLVHSTYQVSANTSDGVDSCPLVIRDKRSLEFTVTRSLMKLFKTGSATIISDCQKFFGFLPITYQIDIRTARFLEKFMTSDNGICMLFERHAKIGRNKIFSTYGNVNSVSFRLEMCHWWTVSLLVTVSIVVNSSYCLEVDYLLNSLFTCHLHLFCFHFYLLLLPFGE